MSYPLDGEQVGTEADDWLHRATPSNIVCNRVIDTLKSEVRQESDIQIRGALNYAIALILTLQYDFLRLPARQEARTRFWDHNYNEVHPPHDFKYITVDCAGTRWSALVTTRKAVDDE